MLTDVCQRARGFRPAGEVIDTSRYEVAQARSWGPIRAFILEEHYSRSFPQTSRGFELRGPGGKLVGAATFGVVPRMYQAPFGERARWLCLSRFVLADHVPGNGETWMLARCFAALRSEGFAGVVSYSDPVPRLDGQGRAAFRGHIGTIYQAHNAVFTGRSKPETKWILPDGGVFESRAANKLTAGDTGHAYAERGLVHFGASPLEPGEDPAVRIPTDSATRSAGTRPPVPEHPGALGAQRRDPLRIGAQRRGPSYRARRSSSRRRDAWMISPPRSSSLLRALSSS